MRACQCPNCSAQISLDDSCEFGFCQYCGTKIMLDDFRSTHRVVDEARIRETETDRIIRLKELELEEKEAERSRKSRKNAYIIAIIMVIVGVILCAFGGLLGILLIIGGGLVAEFTYIGASERKKKRIDERKACEGMIKLTSVAFDYEGKNYKTIEQIYAGLGFKNISVVNLRDLRIGIVKKSGVVESVIIDDEVINGDKWYHPNAKVLITYHGFDE